MAFAHDVRSALCAASLLLLALSLPNTSRAQAACPGADLELTFRFANDAPTTYTLAILARNLSQHACTVAAHDEPTFITQNSTAPAVTLCEDCDRRLPDGTVPALAPLLLQPGEIAYQTFRWRTVPSAGGPACRQARWMTAQSASHQHTLFFVAPTLLPPICSQVDVEGYARGTFLDDDDVPAAPPAKLHLSAGKASLYPDEFFEVNVDSIAGGSPTPAPLTLAPFSPVLRRSGRSVPCPAFFLRERAADGYTRVDEFHTPQLRCHEETTLTQLAGETAAPAVVKLTTTLDSFNHLRALDLGDNTLQLLQMFGSPLAAHVVFAESNVLPIHLTDPAAVHRTWGSTQAGVRVDLTLDKPVFALGEDIPLHIATQVVSAAQPVYGEPFRRRPDLNPMAADAAFHLAITSTDGPEPGTDKPDNLVVPGTSGGPLVCPRPLPVGTVLPFERSLKLARMLPNIPGTYTLVLAWSPYAAPDQDCDAATRATRGEATAPLVTVYSKPVTIHITGGAATPEEVASLPEYTGWRSGFTLVDSSFGKRSALLDTATHLEWLRLSATANKSQETLSHAMAPHRPLEGWRFATPEEVLGFFSHFTGSPDGRSKDPAIERELMDLMGGPLATSKSTPGAWTHSSTTGNVAGFFAPTDPNARPVGAPRFQYRFATITEDLREGLINATVDPGRVGWVDGDRTSPSAGTFLVRAH